MTKTKKEILAELNSFSDVPEKIKQTILKKSFWEIERKNMQQRAKQRKEFKKSIEVQFKKKFFTPFCENID